MFASADLNAQPYCGSSEWIVFKQSCLIKSRNYYTKRNAELFCKRQNATMVKIENNEKYKFIQNLLNSGNDLMYTWVINLYKKVFLFFELMKLFFFEIGAEKDANSINFVWFDNTTLSLNQTFWCKNANLTEVNMNCFEYDSFRKCAKNYYCDADNVYAFCQKEIKLKNKYKSVTNFISKSNTLLLMAIVTFLNLFE